MRSFGSRAPEEDFYAFHERNVGTKTGKTLKTLLKAQFEESFSRSIEELFSWVPGGTKVGSEG